MEICLTHQSAIEFWRSVYAAKMAGSRVPFYAINTNIRPQIQFPCKLPYASDFNNIIGISRNARAFESSPDKICVKCNSAEIKALSSLPLTLPVHALTTPGVSRKRNNVVRSHQCSTQLPNGSLVRLSNSFAVTSPTLTFVQAAGFLNFLDLVQLGYELCGTYSIPTDQRDTMLERRQLTSTQNIAAYIDDCPNVHGVKVARKALRFITDGSDSPMETRLCMLLTLPYCYGGYALPMPQLNENVFINPKNSSPSPADVRTCDLLWREAKLDVEYNGRDIHATGYKQTRDARRYDELDALGYKCITITIDRMRNEHDMDLLALAIAKRIGYRMRPRCKDYLKKKARLRRMLIPGTFDFYQPWGRCTWDVCVIELKMLMWIIPGQIFRIWCFCEDRVAKNNEIVTLTAHSVGLFPERWKQTSHWPAGTQ